MIDYEKLYFTLAARVADAIDHIESQNYGQASDCLIDAHRHCEDLYCEMEP